MENFLSAEELHSRRTTIDRSLPKRGFKCNAPTNDSLEADSVKQLLQDRAKVISEPKVERLSCVMHGEWLPDNRLVTISGNLGKHFCHMGCSFKGQSMLFPEEALYLMDINSLEVYFNELPLSMQEAYIMFLCGNLSLEKYQVYSHLSRLGYIVVQHKGRIKDKHASEASRIALLSDVLRKDSAESSTAAKRLREDSGHDTWECKRMKTFHPSSSNRKDFQKCLLAKHPDVQFPDIFQKHVLKLPSPDKKLLPPNVVISPARSVINLSLLESDGNVKPEEFKSDRFGSSSIKSRTTNARDSSAVGGYIDRKRATSWHRDRNRDHVWYDRHHRTHVNNPFHPPERFDDHRRSHRSVHASASHDSQGQRFDKRDRDSNCRPRAFHHDSDIEKRQRTPQSNIKTSAQCWKEYKSEVSQDPSDRCPKSANLLSMPEVQPLVTSTDLTSVSSVLHKLGIIKQVQNAHFAPLVEPPNVDYDVYLPNTDYNKTKPQLPNHRLIVTRSADPLPKIDSIARTMAYFGDEVGLNFAVVDGGSIAFYSFNDVCLPQEIPMV